MFVNARIILVLKQQMQQLLITQEVQLRKCLPLCVEEHLYGKFQLLKNDIIFFQHSQMLLLLRGQLPQRKIFTYLLRQLLPVTLCVSVGLGLAASLPVGIRKDRLKISQKIMMSLPFSKQQSQGIKHILLILYSIFEFSLLYLGILSDAVDDSNLLVNLFSNQPVMLREVIDQALTRMTSRLHPKTRHCRHLRIQLHLLLRLKHYLLQKVKLLNNPLPHQLRHRTLSLPQQHRQIGLLPLLQLRTDEFLLPLLKRTVSKTLDSLNQRPYLLLYVSHNSTHHVLVQILYLIVFVVTASRHFLLQGL